MKIVFEKDYQKLMQLYKEQTTALNKLEQQSAEKQEERDKALTRLAMEKITVKNLEQQLADAESKLKTRDSQVITLLDKVNELAKDNKDYDNHNAKLCKQLSEKDKRIKQLKDDSVSNSKRFWREQAIKKNKELAELKKEMEK